MAAINRTTRAGTDSVFLIFVATFLIALGAFSVLPTAPAHADPLVANVAVGSTPYWAAVNPSDDMIYVTNFNSHSISVIDGATDAVVDTITVGLYPRGIAIDLSTDMLYVATAGGGISVIDGSTNQVTAIFSVVSTGPQINLWGVAVNPDTDTVYVANQVGGSVIVINGATNAVSDVLTFTPPQQPISVAVDQVTNMVYVASGTPDGSLGYLTVVNGATNAEVTSLKEDASVFDVAVNPVTDTIYASDGVYGIFVVDGVTNTVTATISGANFAGVAVDPSVGKVFASEGIGYMGHVFTIDATTNEITQITTVASGPIHLTTDPSTNMVYAVDAGISGTVFVIDGNPAGSTGSSQLVVTAENTNGQALTGYSTTVSQGGTAVSNSGFTPADYSLSDGQPYTVSAYGYGTCSFDHWSDTGSTSPSRSVSIEGDTQLIAVYNCGPAGSSGVTVNSIDQNGNSITGYYVVLTDTSGNARTGFTPVSFSTTIGTTYSLQADSYGPCTFTKWASGQPEDPILFSASFPQASYTAVYDCAPSGATSSLNISTIDSSGNPITGYYITLWQGGTQIASCFSACSFPVNSGQTYQVIAASYGSEAFNHWANDGSTGAETVSVPGSSTTLNLSAVYQP